MVFDEQQGGVVGFGFQRRQLVRIDRPDQVVVTVQ
jgi:hypothetical protein